MAHGVEPIKKKLKKEGDLTDGYRTGHEVSYTNICGSVKGLLNPRFYFNIFLQGVRKIKASSTILKKMKERSMGGTTEIETLKAARISQCLKMVVAVAF